MMMDNTWTASRVEDLLFRQFMKNEDVTEQLPPAPGKLGAQASGADSVSALLKFVQTTPASNALNQSAAGGKLNQSGATPVKSGLPTPKTPTVLNKFKANAVAGGPKTPTAKRDRADEEGAAAARTPPPGPKTPGAAQAKKPAAAGKREKIEWPMGVPRDDKLRSNSRSAVQHLTERRIRAQQGIDPDLIFQQDGSDFPLMKIFTAHPKALKKIHQVRGLSGDWQTDTFSAQEEDAYKADMKFEFVGPSQAMPRGLF